MPKMFQIEEPHLMDYVHVIFKRRWVVATVFLVIFFSVAIRSFTVTPVYRATAQILIDKENPNVTNIKEILDIKSSDIDYYQTQYNILKSNALALKVIRALNLKDNKEFGPVKEETEAAQNNLIANYLGKLKVEPIRSSRLANVSFDSADKKLAATIANAHARLYIESDLERKFSASQDATGWLSTRIKEVKERLEESETKLQSYRKEQGVIAIDMDEKYNVDSQKLKDLNTALGAAKTERFAKENQYNEMKNLSRNPETIEALPAVVSSYLIGQLKNEYIKISGSYYELSQKYGPEHPKIIRLNSELNELKNKIRQEVQKIAQSIESEYRMAVARERSLHGALEAQKKAVLDFNEKESEFNIIKRDVDANRSLYESLLKRIKETNVTEGISISNIMVIDPARVPNSPVKPKIMQNLLLALVSGLAFGVGLAFFFEYLDNTIKSPDDVKKYLEVPLLGILGKFEPSSQGEDKKEIPLLDAPRSSIAEAIRTVRTNILFSSSDSEKKVILVTSALPSEGKTILSVNLAVGFAQLGKKVLFIDADMRKPRSHTVFKVEREPGLSEILVDAKEPFSIIRDTQVENLKLITCGTIPPNPSELLISSHMDIFIEKMKEQFDIVIFDSPPITSVTDAVEIGSYVDGVVLIIKTGVTPRPAAQSAIHQLSEVNANIFGVVLNDVDFQKENYYYPYYKYYSRYYSRYYYHYGNYYGEDGQKKKTRMRGDGNKHPVKNMMDLKNIISTVFKRKPEHRDKKET
ncbi:MAG: polysaccharide biosynthesis tyrosine autokinase [Proteobacteria bacterium]|nr:polysaccharide biosynthesis tyrosine autokinase [Pseudomonadota bacterium]